MPVTKQSRAQKAAKKAAAAEDKAASAAEDRNLTKSVAQKIATEHPLTPPAELDLSPPKGPKPPTAIQMQKALEIEYKQKLEGVVCYNCGHPRLYWVLEKRDRKKTEDVYRRARCRCGAVNKVLENGKGFRLAPADQQDPMSKDSPLRQAKERREALRAEVGDVLRETIKGEMRGIGQAIAAEVRAALNPTAKPESEQKEKATRE